MEMRKTWFSYLLWLALVGMTAALSAIYLPAAGAEWLGQNRYTAVTAVVLAAGLAVVCWLAGHRTAVVLGEKLPEHMRFLKNIRFRQAAEFIAVLALLAGAVFYRFQMLKNPDVPMESVYYDMAYIKNSGGVPRLAHGASYCYTVVLSAVFSFGGNKMEAGLFFQAALQILSLPFLYGGIKRIAGRMEAFWSVAIFAFLPSYAGKICELGPESFYFFLWSLGIFLIGQCKRAEEKKVSCAVFLLAGIYIGILGFLDISGWLLLLFAGGLCIKDENREKSRSGGVIFGFCLSGAAAGMLCCLALDAALSGSSLGSIWHTWTGLFFRWKSICVPAGPESDPGVGAVLCFGGMLLAIGFWFHKKLKQDVWILFLLAAALLDMWSAGSFVYSVFPAFAWAVLAGMGIASMGGSRHKAEEGGRVTVPDIVLEDMDEDETPGIKLIENPLPLPKKHVHREMDFDRLVESEKMKFDIQVEESDDFDI